MAINGRTKGQRGEREVAAMLQAVYNEEFGRVGKVVPVIERNLQQSINGGHDLTGVDFLSIEVKYQETAHVSKWWEQTLQQSKKAGAPPCLIHRANFQPWRVRMITHIPGAQAPVAVVADISIEAFLVWFRLMVRERAVAGVPVVTG